MSDLSQRLTAALADRYRIEREIGRGGMATVFLARDLKHTRRVAIKVLDPEVAAAIGPERFLREIETTASLTHPHILPLHDSGRIDGLLFYVMPYVEGESLRERLKREKQLTLDDAMRIAREVAEALNCAHDHGVVHRDIKPENILFEEGHAVVADFGIARAIAGAGGDSLTATGIAVGTPSYMSPEQTTADHHIDGRTDQYALGCVLYEMLAGQPPFTGPTAESLAYQHLSVTPRPVTELRPAVPENVTAALQRALAKTPADRYDSVARFAEALSQHVRPAPKPRVATWLAAVAVVLVAYVAIAAQKHWPPFPRYQPNPTHKDWILVAEFDGPANDSTLAAAARSLVSAALDESEILATIPHELIQQALKQAGKPAGTHVSGQLARELAYRRSVRAVLEGEIARIGTGYSIVLRVVEAESLKTVVTVHGSAKDEKDLIPVLGKMAGKLRRDLGEKHDAIAATRPLAEVATPSFEAYRAYVKALQSSDEESAIALSKEALRLDPDFAMAWRTIAVAHWNMGRPDSFLAAVDQALRHPERMTPAQRKKLEANREANTGSTEQGLAVYLNYDRLYPGDPTILNSIGLRLDMLRRTEEALEYYRKAQRQNPFGPGAAQVNNEVLCLLSLGRIDEARERVRALPGPRLRAGIELAACNWAVAESLADIPIRDPRADTFDRGFAFASLAKAQGGRGQLRAAAATLTRGARFWEAASSPRRQVAFGRLLLFLAVQTEGAIALPPESWASDSSAASLVFLGLRAAATGDMDSARRLLEEIQRRPASKVAGYGVSPTLLEAHVLALTGNWEEVVHILQPIAAQSEGGREVTLHLADAFEKLGAPDSAATYLDRMTTDPTQWVNCSGITKPLVYLRLTLLYARMGRLDEAERHLAVLERWWDRPDDIAQDMLDEARNAVRSARGLARPERARTSESEPHPTQAATSMNGRT